MTLPLRHLLCFVLAASLHAACRDDGVRGGDGGTTDSGDADGSGAADSGPPYDPMVGNPFDGALDLDDSRVTMMDPSSLPASASPCREPLLARVRFVTDGDTVSVNGISEPLPGESVRLIGVDTPETAHDGMSADCYGPEAAAFTGQLRDHIVWLTFDAECRDRFGRLLAYVWVGEGPQDMWERQLLRRGFGTQLTISPNTTHTDTLRQDEFTAERDGAGLWSACR